MWLFIERPPHKLRDRLDLRQTNAVEAIAAGTPPNGIWTTPVQWAILAPLQPNSFPQEASA